MAAGTTISATAAAVEVLRAAGKPLTSKEIIDGVLERKDVKVSSRSSIQASIFTAEKNGRLFKRVSKGVYKLHPKVDEQMAKKSEKVAAEASKPKAEKKAATKKAAKAEPEAAVDPEFSTDLNEAVKANDEKAKKAAAKRSATPDPKPSEKKEPVSA